MDSGSAILLMVFIQAVVFLIKLTSKRFKTLCSILSFFQRSGVKFGDSHFPNINTSKFKDESSSLLKYDHLYHDPSYSSSPANIYYDSNKDR